ncbi:MAG: hypothetical protein V1897_06955, partial [Pseudomonadota bacterium]
PKYLTSGDPSIRGLSALALGALEATDAKGILQDLVSDDTEFQIFLDGRIQKIKVLDLVNQSISMLG